MFSEAIKLKWRPDNPCKGVKKNAETKRKRYLTPDELDRLNRALNDYGDKQAATIVRLLLLTGARRGEVLGMRWSQLDLENGKWTKPASTTKQKAEHSVRLSNHARLVLADLRRAADKIGQESDYVFTSNRTEHRRDVRKAWRKLCRMANLRDIRIHDIRHSFASFLVSAGESLETIGGLLGHATPITTARYSHLTDEAQVRAANKVGAIVGGPLKGQKGKRGELVAVEFRGGRR